jgi:hypothetical protein
MSGAPGVYEIFTPRAEFDFLQARHLRAIGDK